MMSQSVALCSILMALLLNLPPAAPVAAPVEKGFTSLFNGKDFTGWKMSRPETTPTRAIR
jgi:hypothetical protein